MQRLVAVVQALSLARALEDVQRIVRQAARTLAGADGATFVLRDGDQCHYADEDAIAPLWKGQRFPMSACVSGWAMLNGEAAVIEDIYADPRIPADAYRPTFVKSLVMVPIRRADPVGAIGAYWATRRPPTPEEVEALQALADSASIAMENVRLYEALEQRIAERTVALAASTRAEAAARHELAERLRVEGALRRSEEQLRQSQKLDAVGQLAGGVAHDFNNVLSVVLGYTSMLKLDLPPNDPIRADIDEIHRAGERAAALTRQLLAFSRAQLLELAPINLGDAVRGVESMLRRLLGADLLLEVVVAPRLHAVLADVGQMEQVLVNLAVNARDAMPRGGKLTIEVANVSLDASYSDAHHAVEPGEYVLLAVTDTGAGMDRETRGRIFEPFFTTKPRGEGTGLGLATVYGIVKQCNGHIWVYSELEEGTTFKVYLPAHAHAAHEAAPRPEPVGRLTGDETLLLVEDDDAVRAVAKGILRRAGYHVLEARNAGEALLTCEQHGRRIHLLITDLVMPRMSGVQLAERLRVIRPELRVLCMSGYTGEAALRHGLIDAGLPFIQKPFTTDGLQRKVREVLDRP